VRKNYSTPENIALLFTVIAFLVALKSLSEYGFILTVSLGLVSVFVFTFGTLKVTSSLSPTISHSSTPLKRSFEMIIFFLLLSAILIFKAITQ